MLALAPRVFEAVFSAVEAYLPERQSARHPLAVTVVGCPIGRVSTASSSRPRRRRGDRPELQRRGPIGLEVEVSGLEPPTSTLRNWIGTNL